MATPRATSARGTLATARIRRRGATVWTTWPQTILPAVTLRAATTKTRAAPTPTPRGGPPARPTSPFASWSGSGRSVRTTRSRCSCPGDHPTGPTISTLRSTRSTTPPRSICQPTCRPTWPTSRAARSRNTTAAAPASTPRWRACWRLWSASVWTRTPSSATPPTTATISRRTVIPSPPTGGCTTLCAPPRRPRTRNRRTSRS